MNKKTAVFAACTVSGVLALSGCSKPSYEYEMYGIVTSGQVDYDCPADVAMAAVGYVAGPKPKPNTNGSHSQEGPGKKPTPSKRVPDSVIPAKKPSGKGVKLDEKPDKPERINTIPAVKHSKKSKGCKAEYELFVENPDGLFEQDVRKVDYDKCMNEKREPFPACTKN